MEFGSPHLFGLQRENGRARIGESPPNLRHLAVLEEGRIVADEISELVEARCVSLHRLGQYTASGCRKNKNRAQKIQGQALNWSIFFLKIKKWGTPPNSDPVIQ